MSTEAIKWRNNKQDFTSRSLNKQFDAAKFSWKCVLSFFDLTHVDTILFSLNNNRLIQHDEILQKNLHKLSLNQTQSEHNPDELIYIYRSRILSTAEKRLLSKGLNIATLLKHFNYATHCLNFELQYRDISRLDNMNSSERD